MEVIESGTTYSFIHGDITVYSNVVVLDSFLKELERKYDENPLELLYFPKLF